MLQYGYNLLHYSLKQCIIGRPNTPHEGLGLDLSWYSWLEDTVYTGILAEVGLVLALAPIYTISYIHKNLILEVS